MANASSGYFSMANETTAGTGVAPDLTLVYPVEEVDFMYDDEMTDIYEIRASRQGYSSFDGAIRPTATIRGALYPYGATGTIFYGLMGAMDSETPDGATNSRLTTFADAAVLPSFTLERSDALQGAGGILCERLAGCKVESVSLSATFGEKIDFETSFQAMKKPATATPQAAVTFPDVRACVFSGATVKVDDVASVVFKSVNMEFRNNLTRQEVLNGQRDAVAIDEASLECTLSATLRFNALTFQNYLLNGTEVELDFMFASATEIEASFPYYVAINYPKVRVSRHHVTMRAGEVMEAEVDFKVLFDPSTSKSCEISIQSNHEDTDFDGSA